MSSLSFILGIFAVSYSKISQIFVRTKSTNASFWRDSSDDELKLEL